MYAGFSVEYSDGCPVVYLLRERERKREQERGMIWEAVPAPRPAPSGSCTPNRHDTALMLVCTLSRLPPVEILDHGNHVEPSSAAQIAAANIVVHEVQVVFFSPGPVLTSPRILILKARPVIQEPIGTPS